VAIDFGYAKAMAQTMLLMSSVPASNAI